MVVHKLKAMVVHAVGRDDGAEGIHVDTAGEVGQDIGEPGEQDRQEGNQIEEAFPSHKSGEFPGQGGCYFFLRAFLYPP